MPQGIDEVDSWSNPQVFYRDMILLDYPVIFPLHQTTSNTLKKLISSSILLLMEKLTWQQIEESYDQQWVQLVEYDWPEGEIRPRSGSVRIHAPTRREFNRLVLEADAVNAARIYVGKHKLPAGTILSSNIVKIVPCEQ